jgi:hypothetical protein
MPRWLGGGKDRQKYVLCLSHLTEHKSTVTERALFVVCRRHRSSAHSHNHLPPKKARTQQKIR